MVSMNLKKLVIGALVSGVVLAANVQEAKAFWWWHSSGGSSGGSWGSGGGSSGGFGWRWRAWHHRHAYWHSSGGSSGGWGSGGGSSGGYSGGSSGGYSNWGSSGGSSGGYSGGSSGGYSNWGSSGGSSGSYAGGSMGGSVGGSSEVYYESAPASASVITSDDSVALTVEVPENAKVLVNGMATKSTGNTRRFVSRGLQDGLTYSYLVRVEAEVDGELKTAEREVRMQRGQNENLSFDFKEAANVAGKPEPTRTTLLLNVPAEAKVFLAGRETNAKGAKREFTTTRLTAGDEWANYTVRIELERDGQTLTREHNVALKAGETKELNVDFNAEMVAQAGR